MTLLHPSLSSSQTFLRMPFPSLRLLMERRTGFIWAWYLGSPSGDTGDGGEKFAKVKSFPQQTFLFLLKLSFVFTLLYNVECFLTFVKLYIKLAKFQIRIPPPSRPSIPVPVALPLWNFTSGCWLAPVAKINQKARTTQDKINRRIPTYLKRKSIKLLALWSMDDKKLTLYF